MINRLRPVSPTPTPPTLDQLEQLRAELADLAFTLERRGRLDAADVANSVSARLAAGRGEAGPKWPEVAAAIPTALPGQSPSGRRPLP